MKFLLISPFLKNMKKIKKVKKPKKVAIKLISVTRSFSYKQNLGNYQMADHFCSQSAEVSEKDAEKVSEALYAFCKKEVIKSINEFNRTGVEEKKVETPLKIKETRLIDEPNLAENLPANFFKPKKVEDKEGLEQMAHKNKKEQKVGWSKEGFAVTN